MSPWSVSHRKAVHLQCLPIKFFQLRRGTLTTYTEYSGIVCCCMAILCMHHVHSIYTRMADTIRVGITK